MAALRCRGSSGPAEVLPNAPEAAAPAPSVVAAGRSPDVRIVVDLARLTAYGMTSHDLVTVLRDTGVEIVREQLTEENGMTALRVDVVAGPQAAKALRSVVLRFSNGAPVRLSDVSSFEALPPR
jgi:multidrug efflux pump subunit AcrB